MYQLPVTNVDKIRKARRSVKKVLSNIGLEDCQEFLKVADENSEKVSDEEDVLDDTEWVDFTEGFNGRMEKRWPYRSRNLCCAMCKYATHNIYNFRSHVSRCHSIMESVCALGICSQCTFVGHPKVLRKHALLFHGQTLTDSQPTKETPSPVTHRANERYQCVRCGFPTSLIFSLKKHIILKHLGKVAEKYIGYRYANQGGKSVKVYCCKVCKGNTGSLDQMLHHMLVSPTHYAVSTQIQSYVYENKNYVPKPTANGNGLFVTLPNFVAKSQQQQPQLLNAKTLILPSNGQPAGTVLTLQGGSNSATLICAPGGNQAFLPPQASALVQLASAEAKGLLHPGATITLQGTLPQGQPIQIPTLSNVAINSATLPLVQASAQPQPFQQPPSVHIPAGSQTNGAPLTTATVIPAATKPLGAPSPTTLQGTMLTSQSLLNHLIPTGNRVNGMPTYTFAPLQVTVPVSQSTVTPLKPIEQSNNSQQVKKWITCPHCNELFPSNIFEMHTEVAHKVKSAPHKPDYLVARASFLKKMTDKSIKCLTCKILVTENTIFQHLLHGLNCVSCTSVFFSIKQLAEHVKQHNTISKPYSDFLRVNYNLYTTSPGVLLFPHFDVQTTGPKEVLGENVVHLALLTSSNEHLYFKLSPHTKSDLSNVPVKVSSTYCPFCDEKSLNEAKHLQHLKQKHFVAPTIHAILKTEAFKCIYCNGVYTGKVTQHAVMLHIQRCRCSPKPPQPPKPAPEPPRTTMTITRAAPVKPVQQMATKAPGLYFLQMPQGITLKQAIAPAAAAAPARQARKEAHVPLKTPEELQSQQRIEQALKEAIAANKRDREERAAKRQRLEHERLEKKKQEQHVQEKPPPEPQADPTVNLVLEPTATERCSEEERRMFCTKYFNCNPYATKAESKELCKRLSLSTQELAAMFSARRTKCMKTIKSNRAVVLLGFDMTALGKLKHNLEIPEQKSPEPSDQVTQGSDEEPMEEEEDEQEQDKSPDKPMESEEPLSTDE